MKVIFEAANYVDLAVKTDDLEKSLKAVRIKSSVRTFRSLLVFEVNIPEKKLKLVEALLGNFGFTVAHDAQKRFYASQLDSISQALSRCHEAIKKSDPIEKENDPFDALKSAMLTAAENVPSKIFEEAVWDARSAINKIAERLTEEPKRSRPFGGGLNDSD